jgi:hypothetical protein
MSELDFEDDTTPVPVLEEGEPRNSQFGESSIVDVLQAEFKELADTTDVYIPVKGYEKTGLQVKYHLPEHGKELDDVARKVQREVKEAYYRNLYTAIDTMIHLTDGLYVQPADVPEPVMLDPQEIGMPVSFDHRLAEILGMGDGEQAVTARQVVRKLFGNNELAIIGHAEKLSRWMQNTKADLSLEVWQLGN